jgi:hypothetical protein
MLDIETAPHLAAVWGLYDQNVALNQLMKPGYTLCWAAKWHGEKKIYFDSILSGEKTMIKGAHKLLEESDAVCHYNGTKFDIPTLNKEFLLNGMKPPAPSAQIDLLRVARSRFKLASNKLDYVAQQLGLGKKLEHKGMELWLECMAKNKASWRIMEQYNKQDVILLEKVYDRLLPWIKNHPNMSVLNGGPVCPNCGGNHSQARGIAMTAGGKYRRYQCIDCGTWHRDTKTLIARGTEKRMRV